MTPTIPAPEPTAPALADFLLARYAEREVLARDFLERYARALNGEYGGHAGEWYGGWWAGAESLGCTPDEVLADLASKRRIVEEFGTRHRVWVGTMGSDPENPRPEDFVDGAIVHPTGPLILRLLAEPFTGHPDYRQEWRP